MAVVDLPLEELKKYKGSSPCPTDIDEYWDSGLEEMKSVDPQIELTPADFKCDFADCYDMYFTGVGGARIYAKLLKPKNAVNCPGLVEFHGYTGNSGDWFDKLPYVAQGFIVASLDCRGQSGRSEDVSKVTGATFHGHIVRGLSDNPEKLLFRQIFLDTAQLAGIVIDMDEVDENRVFAKGGSQGGGLTIACGALEPRIKKLACEFPFLCDYKRVWQLDLGTAAYIEIKEFIRWFDPLHEKFDEIFYKLGYIDVQNLAKRIKGEVLMSVTLRDDVCPPSTQFAVYDKIRSKKDMVIYHDFTHEALPLCSDRAFKFLTKS